jgi:hypothetical protein
MSIARDQSVGRPFDEVDREMLQPFRPSGPGRKKGMVPAPPPTAGDEKFLCEDGTWAVPGTSGGGGGIPAAGSTVVDETSYGQSSTAGVASTFSRSDHSHGTPAEVTVPSFSDDEAITGDIDGVNTDFFLAHEPDPPESLILFVGAVFRKQGTAYTLVLDRVRFEADYIPQVGDELTAFFRY